MKDTIQILSVAGDQAAISIPTVRTFTVKKTQLMSLHRAVSGFIAKEMQANPHLSEKLTELSEALQKLDEVIESIEHVKETE